MAYGVVQYVVIDKETKEAVSQHDNKEDAEVWCEENAVDLDYFEIVKDVVSL